MKKDKQELNKIISSIKDEISFIKKFKHAYEEVHNMNDNLLFSFSLVAHDNLIKVLEEEIKVFENIKKEK